MQPVRSSIRTRHRRARRGAIAAALAIASLAPASSGKPEAAPKEVRIGYFANVTHAQALLAVESGDFAEAVAPSTLATRTFNAGPSLVEALFAGEIDIGYIGPSPALSAHAQSRGQGIRVIAGAAANGVVIVARPGSGIDSLEDLKGRRIATPQLGNTQDVSARHYLKSVLGQKDTENVTPVPNAEQPGMMLRGEIDAAWAVEPWASRLENEAGAVVIAEEKDLWPDGEFVLTLVVTTPEFLAKNPEIVERVLRKHCEWTRRLQADAAAQAGPVAAAISRLTDRQIPEDLVAQALTRVKFTDQPLASSIKTFAKWNYELGMTRQPPRLDGLVDTTILDSLGAEGPVPAEKSP